MEFIIEDWMKHYKTQLLERKSMYVTCVKHCYKISAAGYEVFKDLQCTHEEADTRLFLHGAHASCNG